MTMPFPQPSGAPASPAVDPAHAVSGFARAQQILHRACPEDAGSAILQALEVVGLTLKADRAYVFQIVDDVLVSNTHEWCAQGVTSVRAELQDLAFDVGDPVWVMFAQDGLALVPDIRLIPFGTSLRQVLEQQSIKSLILVALWRDGQMTGFLGLDYVRSQRDFSSIETGLLSSLAASIALSLHRAALQQDSARVRRDLFVEQERVAAVVASAPELLVETDSAGTIVGFRQSDPLVFALNPQEVIGQPCEAVLPAHVAQIVRRALDEAARNGESRLHSYSIRFPDGTKFYSLRAKRSGAVNALGQCNFLFVVRDETESHTRDQKIRQLVRVAELSTNLIILTDESRRITWMNPAGASRTGFGREEVLDLPVCTIFGLASDDPGAMDSLCPEVRIGGSVNRAIEARNKRGIAYWIELNVQPLQAADGRTQGYMIVGVDITGHKRAEARAQRERSKAMEATREGVVILTSFGHLSYVNQPARDFLGIGADQDISGKAWRDLLPARHNIDLESARAILLAQGYWNGEVMAVDHQGQDHALELSIAAQDDGTVFVIARDVTARHHAQAERAALSEQLQIVQARQLLSQLAGGLAHDLANILAVILGSLDQVGAVTDPLLQRNLNRIRAAGAQGQALLSNLMQLGKSNPDDVMSDLRQVLRETVELSRPILSAEIELRLEIMTGQPCMGENATKLMQILLNLLLNAHDAVREVIAGTASGTSQPGQREAAHRPSITLRLKHPAPADLSQPPLIGQFGDGRDYVLIEVSDTGCGIPPEHLKDIFKPYFTTKGQKGSGLGLAIVGHLVQRHGAALQACANETRGTRMRLFWPLALQRPAALAAGESDRAGRPASPLAVKPLQGLNLLLVDDDDEILQSLSELLAQAGAEVASCIDPLDAIEAFAEDPEAWDGVISDYTLGPMTGAELARSLRALRSDIQLFLLTGASELQFANEPIHTLFNGTLQKPYVGSEVIGLFTSRG